MPKTSALPVSTPPDYDPDMEARVAVLEQIAVSTEKALTGLREDLREFRQEMPYELGRSRDEMRQDLATTRDEMRQDTRGFREEVRQDFHEFRREVRHDIRWLLALGIAAVGVLLAVMAHGFRWF